MKRRWIKKLAIILSVCLILNSGVLELTGEVYAAAKGNTLSQTMSAKTPPSDGGSLPETPPSDSGSLPETPQTGESLSEEESSSSEVTQTTESAPTETSSEENSTEESTTEESGESATEESTTEESGESATEEPSTEESTTEEATTEEATTESAEDEALSDSAISDAAGRANIPDNLAEYLKEYGEKNEIIILTVQDLVNLQTLCAFPEVEGFKDKTITFGSSGNTETEGSVFEGIGTKEHPFQGTFKGYYKIDGSAEGSAQLVLHRPLFAYLGDSAKVQQLSIRADGCNSPIANHITGAVEINNVKITGNTGNGSEPSGTVAGTIKENADVAVSSLSYESGKITGRQAGAIAGIIENGAAVTLDDTVSFGKQDSLLSIEGTESAGALYGAMKGSHTVDLNRMAQFQTEVRGENSANGQITGLLAGGDTKLTLTGSEIKANVTNGKSSGGIVGTLKEGASIIFPTGPFTITGTIAGNGNGGTAGGIIGSLFSDAGSYLPDDGAVIEAQVRADLGAAGGAVGTVEKAGDQNIIISKITIASEAAVIGRRAGGMVGKIGSVPTMIEEVSVEGSITKGSGNDHALGGIIGEVSAGKVIIKEPNVAADFKTGRAGGILGALEDKSAVELQGTVRVKDRFSDKNNAGSIAFMMNETCLLYLDGIAGMIDGKPQLEVPDMDEVIGNNSACVFRNQNGTSNGRMIGDGTLENVGRIYNNVETVLGEGGAEDAAADLTAFAIVTFTRGNFGREAFQDKDLSDIQGRTYTLQNDVDISYDKTGILSLNRNDNGGAEPFTGSIIGKEGGVTITQNHNPYKRFTGVFGHLAGDNTFENLTIAGNVPKAYDVGGLAYSIKGSSLTLKNVSIKKTFQNPAGTVGGVIAAENSSQLFSVSAENVILASKIEAGTFCDYSGFITNMDHATVKMKNIQLGGRLQTNGSGETGGFFGKKWEKTGGTIESVSVQLDTSYATNGSFGGFFHTVSNQATGSVLTLKDVKLENLSVRTNKNAADCGLLLSNGKNVVLEVINYDAQGATVTGAAADFDEIAGVNSRDNQTYGVISIHNTEKEFNAVDGYHYENQATYQEGTPTGNPNTRYYYDVFQHLNRDDGTPKVIIENNQIDSAEKYFLWDIVQCSAPASSVAKTFEPYFKETLPGKNGNYTISGTLNLSPYSVYPAPGQSGASFTGTNGAKLIFAAEGMQDWKLPNIEKNNVRYQHNGLHCGFLGTTGNGSITVDNIAFSGTIGALPANSCGVLIAGALNGDGKFTNITLDNLRIAGYGTDADNEGASLLIGQIPSSTEAGAAIKTVEFGEFDENGSGKAGVKMINYTNAPYAGASLIHKAGNKDGTNLALRFSNMALEYDEKTAGVLQYSSFLYEYHYTNNAAINKSSGLYLFKKEDAKANPRNVTYGAELDDTTEYYDTSETVFTKGTKPEDKYIPYVYHSDDLEKEIEVNPKSGDILKGCGTYEDPYVIETTKQFLTLYRYINEPRNNGGDYQYQSFYKNWKMIQTGSDASDDFCSSKHRVELADAPSADGSQNGGFYFTGTGNEDARVFGQDGFPTPDQLAQAYYQLGADIDLSGITKGTYGAIAEDFMGFGTLERPFVGVWYGKDENGDMHTITLPDKKKSVKYERYGFIQYAKGAVVKDVIIKTSHDLDLNSGYGVTALDTHGVYGSVFAYILGGDNIIDNVKIETKIQSGECSLIGGYVGVVKKGGLILRNLKDSAFADFRIEGIGSKKAMYGAVAGKVEDGYVLAESGDGINIGSADGKKVLDNKYSGIIPGTETEAIPNYKIINAVVLKKDLSGNSEITVAVSGSGQERNVAITIPNAAGLMVMAMAMNADALNVYPSDYQDHDDRRQWGYSENARCRKAAYSDIGNVTDQNDDYKKAVRYDNTMGYIEGEYTSNTAYAYPYLYDYMGLTGNDYLKVTVTDGNKVYSVLNSGETLANQYYHVYWNLDENGNYDLTPYQGTFQGIGALYDNGGDYGASFRGSFNGKGSSISYKIERKLYYDFINNNFASDRQKSAGLFNSLRASVCRNDTKGIYNAVEDFGYSAYNGENPDQFSSKKYACYLIQNVNMNGNITASVQDQNGDWKRSGYVIFGQTVGVIEQGNYAFQNITSKNVKLNDNSISVLGGFIGKANADTHVMMKDCSVAGTQTNPAIIESNGFTGGFIGQSTADVCKIVNSSANYVDVASKNENAGGFVGHADETDGSFFLLGQDTQEATVANCNISAFYNAGAFVGESRCAFYADSLAGTCNTIASDKSMGGLIGELASSKESEIRNIKITDVKAGKADDTTALPMNQSNIGGAVGFSDHVLHIQEVSVTGTKTEDQYSAFLSHTANVEKEISLGGIIGKTGNETTITDCEVNAVKIIGETKNANVFAGGLIGYADAVSLQGTSLSENTVIGQTVGGAFGYVNLKNAPMTCKDLSVAASAVVGSSSGGRRSAGGFVGEFSGSAGSGNTFSLFDSELKECEVVCETAAETISERDLVNYAAGGAMGRISAAAGEILCDNVILKENNKIGLRKTKDTAIKLLKAPENLAGSWKLSDVSLPDLGSLGSPGTDTADFPKKYQATAKLTEDYGYCVGTIVGMMETSNVPFYMMCSDDAAGEYTIPVMEYNPPVTDVGVYKKDQLNETGDAYYRKSSHIIYGAPVTDMTIDGVSFQASDPFKNVAYMQKRVEQAEEKYSDTDTLKEVLKTYRLSKQAIEIFNNAYEESYTYPETSHTMGPVLVYRTGTADLQTMIEAMADIMTNVAGASATDLDKKRLEVTAVQKLVRGNAGSADAGSADGANVSGGNTVNRTGSITDSGEEPSIAVSYEDNQWIYRMNHEDGLTADGSAMSYTELTFTYKLDEDKHQKVFKLPIFVEEPLYYGVNMKILEGNAASVRDVKEKGIPGTTEGASIVIANDSSYTLLMEYTYGKARKKMPETVATEKTFRLEPGIDADQNKVLPIGTKLRLIDVTHGNTPYYYEVKQENITEIRFSEFKDHEGKPYQNQPLKNLQSEGTPSKDDPNVYEYEDLDGCKLSDTGVERYLLTVYNADTTEMAYEIHTDIILQIKKGNVYVDASDFEKTHFIPLKSHEKMPFFKVAAIKALDIRLKDGDEYTNITGKISRNETVIVRATYEIKAEGLYWALKKQGTSLDSKNNDKYLELAFYLRDKTRVSLPDGTIVSLRTNSIEEDDAEYDDGKVVSDGSVLYSYKDIFEKENPLNDLLDRGENSEHTVEFKLSFANADLSSLESKEYEGWIELLRTSDSQYPMGSGNKLDDFYKPINAESVKSIGFAILPDKTEQLAVNTYPTAASENRIEYKTMFDFSDILDKISGAGKEEALKKWAGFDYNVTYSLLKKQKNEDGTVSYTEYTGDDIVITADESAGTSSGFAASSTDSAESAVSSTNSAKSPVSSSDSAAEFADSPAQHTSQNGKLKMTYHFTKEEIDQKEAAGLILRTGNISIHTADLVKEQQNLTNYQIVAELTICEPGMADTENVSKTEDFFVFTITKLKNDLSQ